MGVRAVCERGTKVKQLYLLGVQEEHHKRVEEGKEPQSSTGVGVVEKQWKRCEVPNKLAYVV